MDLAPNSTGILPENSTLSYAEFGKQIIAITEKTARLNVTSGVLAQNDYLILVGAKWLCMHT